MDRVLRLDQTAHRSWRSTGRMMTAHRPRYGGSFAASQQSLSDRTWCAGGPAQLKRLGAHAGLWSLVPAAPSR